MMLDLEEEEEEEKEELEFTWAESLQLKGWKKGWALAWREGWKEGLQEVRRMGARQLLLELLDQRFGPLPESIPLQVEAISSMERLRQLARQILVARSLEEMDLG